MTDFLFKTIENYPVLVTVVFFALGIIGFFIRRWFFKENDDALIKAGGSITAGGDIIAGNKTVISHKKEEEEKNLKNFEKFIETEEWQKEFINNKEIWICQKDNTYQIEHGENDREFKEDWTIGYPDKSSYCSSVYLKIGGVRIKELSFVSLDGGRIFVPVPEIAQENDRRIYLWNKNSLEYKIGKVIGTFYIYESLEGIGRRSNI